MKVYEAILSYMNVYESVWMYMRQLMVYESI